MQRDTSHESAAGPSQPAPNSELSSTSTDNVCQALTLSRRNGVNDTCEACRKSNTQCSGDQPTCVSCAQQDAHCQYASAETEAEMWMRKLLEEKKKSNEYQYFFDAVKNMPQEESQAVYRLVRQRADIKTVVHQIKERKDA
ncbi:uncharacterized protein TrAtP1_009110 [Trichoderma atroviride]|uniref:uncharacterized protein n=1 Tax=Hypocrea atroviridis TaxID=63577 RepID=UPI003327C642|nr:hypothetical protein TrAtP1_009110 [Trichoderma atroviride]